MIIPNYCPLCGHAPEVSRQYSGEYDVSCRNNDCNFHENTWPQETKEQAILEWNKMIKLYTFKIGKEYTCTTKCPELDRNKEKHCTTKVNCKDDIEYLMYHECPCGNISKWEEII